MKAEEFKYVKLFFKKLSLNKKSKITSYSYYIKKILTECEIQLNALEKVSKQGVITKAKLKGKHKIEFDNIFPIKYRKKILREKTFLEIDEHLSNYIFSSDTLKDFFDEYQNEIFTNDELYITRKKVIAWFFGYFLWEEFIRAYHSGKLKEKYSGLFDEIKKDDAIEKENYTKLINKGKVADENIKAEDSKKELPYLTCINELRKKLLKKLKHKFDNEESEIFFKTVSQDINKNFDTILMIFADKMSKLQNEGGEKWKLIYQYLKRTSKESRGSFSTNITPNTLEQFLEENTKEPNKECLHKYAVYQNYIGWNHFVDVLNKKKEKYFYEEKEKRERRKRLKEDVPIKNNKEQEKLLSELRQGSKRYFKELTSENGRYSHFEINNEKRFIETTIYNEESKLNLPLLRVLQSLWFENSRHTLLTGEGGMGKTLSFVRLWQFFLKKNDSPIPIYISLNEYNTNEKVDNNYLIKYISWNYLGIKPLDEKTEQKLRKIFVDGKTHKINFVLFLDGFNEITIDKAALLDDLKWNWKTKAQSTQIVISSRYNMRHTFGFTNFHLLKINPIPEKIIIDYLSHFKVSFSSLLNFQKLLKNPMMLSLYASAAPIIEKYKGNPYFDFKPIESQGELLWNYFESQYVKYFEFYSSNERKTHFYKFLFKHYLPFIGYEMEKKGKYFLTPNEKDEILKQTGDKFYNLKFTNAFREYKKFIRHFKIKTKDDVFEEDERIEYFSDILTKELQVLIVENVYFWFQHQNFRDYFASIHIINEMEVQIIQKEIPSILGERILPTYLQKFIGEIEGEHHYKPTIVEDLGWSIDYKENFKYDKKVPKTKSLKLLDWCRDKYFKDSIEIITQNLIYIINQTRGELSGIDLSSLNLTEVNFNGKRCFRKYQDKCLSVKFDYSLILDNEILPKEQINEIKSLIYSPDGNKIAIISKRIIYEWSVKNGKLLKSYLGHTDYINSLEYSFDGTKILSASDDKTIREWSTQTGKCINTITEEDRVNIAKYSPNSKTILFDQENIIKNYSIESENSISTDLSHSLSTNTFKFNKKGNKFLSVSNSQIHEWKTETMELIQTYKLHNKFVKKIYYMPDDEDIILCQISTYGGFEIHSLSQKKQLKWFIIDSHHKESVVDLIMSKNGEKVLGSTNKGNIYLWKINSQDYEPIKEFNVANERTNFIALSPNEQKLLHCSVNKNVEELSLTTGEVVKSFGDNGNNYVNAISYSPCGTKFIIGTSNGIIQEWNFKLKKWNNLYLSHTEPINDVIYSPDGKNILSCSDDGTVKFWSTETSICIHTFNEHKSNVRAVAYSNDGKMIASCSKDKTLNIWSTKTKELIRKIKDPDLGIFDIDFSPDGKKILATSNTVREWSIETGDCIEEYKGHKRFPYCCAYHPNGEFFVSGSRDCNIKFWKSKNKDYLNTIHAQRHGVSCVVFSPDGKKILTCGNNHFLYEWVIGQEQNDNDKIKAHDDTINQVVYSPDGDKVLSCSNDGTVKEWLVKDWSCIETYKYTPGLYVNGCTFNKLHKDSNISKDNKIVLEKYGAIFE